MAKRTVNYVSPYFNIVLERVNLQHLEIPSGNYMFKVNNRSTRTSCYYFQTGAKQAVGVYCLLIYIYTYKQSGIKFTNISSKQ